VSCTQEKVIKKLLFSIFVEEERYEKFRRQHISKKMTENDCDQRISQNKIYKNDNSCKETNTFILDDAQKVKDICKGKKDGMTKSTKTFSIVVCKLKNEGARKPKCQYRGKHLTNRVVAIKCEGGLPVHFERDILNAG
uniref:Ribonuclease A-domain domain-containing protein n=1 Tax=Anabas testudineus TaxID=64144 RepID=A0A3Q1J1H0_ANATE